MDRHIKTPPQIHSFNLNEEPPPSPVDSTKKRKLQYGQVGLPLSKHKFRDRSCGLDNESSNKDNIEADENVLTRTYEVREERNMDDDGEPEHSVESVKDSNSFAGSYSTSATLDGGSRTVSFEEACHRGLPSTSSNGSDNDAFRNALYSLDSRSMRSSNPRERTPFQSKEAEREIQLEHEFTDYKDQLLEFGAYNIDHVPSESESNEIEHLADAGKEDLLLYSNDVTSNVSMLSSGRWDGKMGTRKPTIDQEFEQYFSTLML